MNLAGYTSCKYQVQNRYTKNQVHLTWFFFQVWNKLYLKKLKLKYRSIREYNIPVTVAVQIRDTQKDALHSSIVSVRKMSSVAKQ